MSLSLIGLNSSRAAVGEVNLKTKVSGSEAKGLCTNTLIDMFLLVGRVVCRSTKSQQRAFITSCEPFRA